MMNMLIDVALTPEVFQNKVEKSENVVIIDVLRASSSIITALSNGAVKIIPAASKEEALAVGGTLKRHDILYCGERDGLKIEGFDLGNSPREYTEEMVGGKVLIFTSTNGSGMILKAVQKKRNVCIAGFLNGGEAAKKLAGENKNCLLACSGREGQFSLEDAVCAGMLAVQIRDQMPSSCMFSDEALAAVVLYRHFTDDLLGMARNSFHGRYLTGLGLGDDIPYCTAMERYAVVPIFLYDGLVLM